MKYLTLAVVIFSVISVAAPDAYSQNLAELRYDPGTPTVVDYYIDPQNGDDSNNGTSMGTAFKTLSQGWAEIPQGRTLTTGYRLNILPGTLPESSLPNYLESRHGTYSAPIIFRALNGRGTVILGGDLNVYDTRYLYLEDLAIIPSPAGDAFHCEKCSYLLIRNSELSGGNQEAHETVKVNQSDHIYIEDSNIHGADDNAIDFVAVEYGHVARNRIHNAQDWCEYAKGGSAYLRIEGNEIYDCGTGGFTAGQGTGFEFMTSPWLHYEAYDMKIINNVIHDTQGAGLGVNGGYNILLAYNTLYRIGSRSHTVEVVFGSRSCDGDQTTCQHNLDLGGWGTVQIGEDAGIPIGNKNVYVYNNVIYNPSNFSAPGQHFALYGPQTVPGGSNEPSPAISDSNLQIRGNYILNNPGIADLGISDSSGCQPSNTTCNALQVAADNTINTLVPEFMSAVGYDFRPTAGSNLLSAQTFSIPSFPGGDRVSSPLAPEGNLDNSIVRDRGESTRASSSPPGAYASADSSLDPPGGGSNDGGSSDSPPTIRKVQCTPKKVQVKQKITCKVTASDDHGISRIIVQSGSQSARLKKSGAIYKGTIQFKKKGKYTLVALATDTSGKTTSANGGRVVVRK